MSRKPIVVKDTFWGDVINLLFMRDVYRKPSDMIHCDFCRQRMGVMTLVPHRGCAKAICGDCAAEKGLV